MTLPQIITRKRNEHKKLKAQWFNLSVLDCSIDAKHLVVKMDILQHEIQQLRGL